MLLKVVIVFGLIVFCVFAWMIYSIMEIEKEALGEDEE